MLDILKYRQNIGITVELYLYERRLSERNFSQ